MMFGLSPVKNEMLNRGSAYGDFYNAIDNFFNDDFYRRPDLLAKGFRMDVKETGEAYIVEAELPGVKRDEIEIGYHQDTLYIATHFKEDAKQANHEDMSTSEKMSQADYETAEGMNENCEQQSSEAKDINEEKIKESEGEKIRYIHQERKHISMQRGIYLPEIKKDAIEAKLDSGILTIIVPKQKASDEAYRIQIQ